MLVEHDNPEDQVDEGSFTGLLAQAGVPHELEDPLQLLVRVNRLAFLLIVGIYIRLLDLDWLLRLLNKLQQLRKGRLLLLGMELNDPEFLKNYE